MFLLNTLEGAFPDAAWNYVPLQSINGSHDKADAHPPLEPSLPCVARNVAGYTCERDEDWCLEPGQNRPWQVCKTFMRRFDSDPRLHISAGPSATLGISARGSVLSLP